MKTLYPLGSGCFPYSHVTPNLLKYREYLNIFKGVGSNKHILCLNLLFSGKLRETLLNGTYESGVSYDPGGDSQNVANIDLYLRNKESGMSFHHLIQRKGDSILRKKTLNEYFDHFYKYKNDRVYTLDFSRGGFQKTRNEELLEFERILSDNNFDIDNFYYLDLDKNSNRFLNCKIKLISCPEDSKIVKHPDIKSGKYEMCCSCYFYKKYESELISKLES